MHPSRAFAWTDRQEMLDFVGAVSFCTIFIAAADGAQVIHVPVVVSGEGRLTFHVARANRARELDGKKAFLSCLGPHDYISPDWYGTADQVPTWNYMTVECEGSLRRLDDQGLVEQLDTLSAFHEARLEPKLPWTRDKMSPGLFDKMTRAIIGYELVVEEMRGTRKLGQHKTSAERQSVAAEVAATGNAELAALMWPPVASQ